jgi:hypothetical protein
MTPTFPFFKETETNARCCGCNKGKSDAGAPSQIPSVAGVNLDVLNTMPQTSFFNSPEHVYKVDDTASIKMLKKPRELGTGQYTTTASPNSGEYQNARQSINLNLAYNDKKNY